MMKKLIMAGIAMFTVAISSCDDETMTTGYSLTDPVDLFSVATDTFKVNTRSITVDSVLARSAYSYLGRLKDPETGAIISSDYMTQFSVLENEAHALFAIENDTTEIISRDAQGEIIADSCYLTVLLDSYQGDSLAAMKINLCELARPVEENVRYYSNFDPAEKGYLRTDDGAINQNKLFSVANLVLSDSVRYARQTNGYYDYFSIPLNKPYRDKEGNEYNNYGTYLMRKFYSNKDAFKNSFNFTQQVCPGFYLQTTDGLGLMAKIYDTQLSVYYRFRMDTTEYLGSKTFHGTQEVLQTTHIQNDRQRIEQLAADNTCTYLKTPAGIFTEVQLPIDEIKITHKADGTVVNHENDSIVSAKIVFQRLNSQSTTSSQVLKEPTNLLMIERDSLYSYFENGSLPNSVTSYMATYDSKSNYTYSNISGLINHMYAKKNKSEYWNRVVLIPVEVVTTSSNSSSSYYSYYYSSSSTATTTGVNNEMSITSARLAGGSNNQHTPITISVIYSKND